MKSSIRSVQQFSLINDRKFHILKAYQLSPSVANKLFRNINNFDLWILSLLVYIHITPNFFSRYSLWTLNTFFAYLQRIRYFVIFLLVHTSVATCFCLFWMFFINLCISMFVCVIVRMDWKIRSWILSFSLFTYIFIICFRCIFSYGVF